MKTKKTILVVSALIVGVLAIYYLNNTKEASKVQTIPEAASSNQIAINDAHVESKKVCFVNNQFMSSDQIPVIVDNKTYYGCCEGCVTKLQQNLGNVRFSIDPLTGEKVDKATAYIVLKQGGGIDVQYFASEKNYLAFAKL